MFFDFLHPLAFLLALAVGIFHVYITSPAKRIVYKYPTPDNINKIIYRDDAGTCYKYKMEEGPCPKNSNQIKEIPLQQN